MFIYSVDCMFPAEFPGNEGFGKPHYNSKSIRWPQKLRFDIILGFFSRRLEILRNYIAFNILSFKLPLEWERSAWRDIRIFSVTIHVHYSEKS